MRRIANRDERAVQRLAQIETSLRELDDEDLLDLADIFRNQPHTPISEIVAAEMNHRNISL